MSLIAAPGTSDTFNFYTQVIDKASGPLWVFCFENSCTYIIILQTNEFMFINQQHLHQIKIV